MFSGTGVDAYRADLVRTAMTVAGAAIGAVAMGTTAVSLVPEGTPVAERILVAIPSAGIATEVGTIAGRWVADAALALRLSHLAAPIIGAGLGATAGAFVAGVSFAIAIAIPTVTAPPGYRERGFTYPQAVAMGIVAGAFWDGLAGLPIDAVAVPIHGILISLVAGVSVIRGVHR